MSVTNMINSGCRILYNGFRYNNVTAAFICSKGNHITGIKEIKDFNTNRENINYYFNKNISNCGYAASLYATYSGETGVCIVDSSVKITNMINSLLNAKNNKIPIVVFSSQSLAISHKMNIYQETPITELTRYVTKWNYQITDIYEMEPVIDEAFTIANSGNKGVVHIDIPNIVLYQEYDPIKLVNDNFKKNDDYYKLENFKLEDFKLI